MVENVSCKFVALMVLSLTWHGIAGAQSPGSDPTPGTMPDIELDGSIGPGGDVPFDDATDTWQIGDDLGEYNGSGTSLFHSFGRFNVSQGDTAEFSANLGAPDRVFARVTWGELSSIEGTLRNAIAGSDLYLINPAGIRIGGGGNIDVPGSFYATTAGRIDMQDGASFEAYGGAAPPLLSLAEPSAFGFLPATAEAASESILFFALNRALYVPAGETLAAIGGNVIVQGGGRPAFSSPGSRIALIAAGPGVDVPAQDLASFDPAGVASEIVLGDVVINDTRIFVSNPAGSILIRGENFELSDALIAVVLLASALAVFQRRRLGPS
jgi:filamentous hemagglutinin family protein